MIHDSFYLYSNKIEAFTNLLDPWTNERYRKVYNRNLKIYRGTDARVDVQVKNCDQKPTSIEESYLVFVLVTKETQRQVIKKDFLLIDDGDTTREKGRAYVILTRNEMRDLEPGFYQYSVIREEREYNESENYLVTSSSPLYVDSQFGAYATLEILGDVEGEPRPSLEITEYTYVSPSAVGDSSSAYNIFSLIDAHPHTNTALSSHTFQFFHSENYTGKITIQGSLDESADPFNWIDIPDSHIKPGNNQFSTQGTTTYKNVIGKWKWFRVITGASFNGSARFVIGQSIIGEYSVSVYDGGKNYNIGQQLIISGDRLGGYAGVNDLTITIESVNFQGSIIGVSNTGLSVSNTRTFVLGSTGTPSSGIVDKILYR